MAKYLVPAAAAPGIYRHGIGFFGPGSVIELPDAASGPTEVPGCVLEPLDAEAAAILRKAHGDLAKPLPQDVADAIAAAKPKDDTGKQQTLKDAAAGAKRASDR